MHQLGIQIFRLLILAQEFGCDALYPIAEVFDIHRHFLIFGKDKRSVTLGIDQRAEGEKVRELIDGKMVYQLCYSGGEICPVYDENGKTTNRFHNFSFVVCIF